MFQDLQGKSALVTGASGGLGLYFAELLARNGVSVALAARRKEALDEAVARIRSAGGDARALPMDVSDGTSVAAAFAQAPDGFDILINNAGIAGAVPALDLDEAGWDQVLDVNLKGSFLVAQAAARALKQAGRGGAIVNIASVLGLRVAGNVSAYAASKAGIIQLTKALALEWARHGIRVNALCPGYIETEMNTAFFASEAGQGMVRRIPQRRLGKPEELAGALLLLASDAGSYMTGSTIEVDGGHLVSSL
ncbi:MULTISPECIES: SDR family NAD(P)-dependent oxidoreductase [unclassified Mesorhizobium]|uniref:SDR family NAD(P)-dependent oxidoreductase n=1 Tax=unclassified Mesorhizobium TaxID=325217 RepID=UPI00086F5470|nr:MULTISPECIES: SDR family NAD(P)-dependent oxidoreductase [unclassified Mesorhizobium]MBN9257952.1 SDR family oxidoreductase [Mesorhizobium sp.]MBN9272569.1 SDR family oxidoreductase [Mesorhizobium sp.]ODT18846.1 MAG: 2-deoxy-D-gluconate 3-dehydrogenase [Mesorhizobium sp. SCN 65-12]OJX76161.1 MAG: 2-deoxy-D-gluconate 3-dehydrogenase [Mesorhizobium sp. 65-26]